MYIYIYYIHVIYNRYCKINLTLSSYIYCFKNTIFSVIFYVNLINRENQIVVPLLLMLNSFVIRPDGFLAIVYFILPGMMYLIYCVFKRDIVIIKNFFIFTLTNSVIINKVHRSFFNSVYNSYRMSFFF